MYRCALQRMGEKLEEEKSITETPNSEQTVSEIADILSDEASLYHLARSDSSILEAMFKVAHRIQQEMEDSRD